MKLVFNLAFRLAGRITGMLLDEKVVDLDLLMNDGNYL